MAGSLGSLANRLYRGEAGVNVVGRRARWFGIAGALLLIAIISFAFRGFTLGIEFRGGNEFTLPASVGTLTEAEDAVEAAMAGTETGGEPARVISAQELRPLGGGDVSYVVRTTELTSEDTTQVKERLASDLGIPAERISDSRVSSAWGSQVTRQALIGLGIFLVLVVIYLIFRFEWRMAVAAVASLALDLVLTTGVYSLIGFEVTPSTIIGFLTILGFALYDVVVVFDKVQENTRGITASGTQTYGEAANLAVNQTLMRSINTGLVALLPVGGLLFIGAGLLGAGTLKDLGLVLFVGMGTAVYSSIFFATPVLVTLKEQEPRLKAQKQRVLARRAAGQAAPGGPARPAKQPARQPAAKGAKAAPAKAAPDQAGTPAEVGARASSAAPRPAARSGGKAAKRGGKGGPRGGRPGGAKRR